MIYLNYRTFYFCYRIFYLKLKINFIYMGNTIKGNPLDSDEFKDNYIIREKNTNNVFGDHIELD